MTTQQPSFAEVVKASEHDDAPKISEYNGAPKTSEHNVTLKTHKHKNTHKTHEQKSTHNGSEQKDTHKTSEDKGTPKEPEHKKEGKPQAAKIVTSISEVPVTGERDVFTRGKDDKLADLGTARANLAATVAAPEGTTENDWARKHSHQTVLQQHCEFFDRDRDGILWPQDTFIGFHRLGFGIILSLVSVFIIHLNFAYPTQKSWIPDPRLLVHVDNIHKDKHGGDSGTYDNEGRFVSQHFENIFAKYGEGRDYLTLSDLAELWNGQRVLNDPVGMGAAFFEWIATYLMLWPEDGKMKKEDIRGVFDGSIFYTIAARREAKQKKQ